MKTILITIITICLSLKSFSQQIVFRDTFEDTTSWKLTVFSSVDSYATAKFEDRKLWLLASQGSLGYGKAEAILNKKLSNIKSEDNYRVEVFLNSLKVVASYDFVINLSIKGFNIKLKHDCCNYFNIFKSPIFQFDITDSVEVKLFDSTSTDVEEIDNFNDDFNKIVSSNDNPDSLKIHLQAIANSADQFAQTLAVFDSIIISVLDTTSVIDTTTHLIAKNISSRPKIISNNNRLYLEFEDNNFYSIAIFDITGRSMYTGRSDKNQFFLNFLPKGIYVINILKNKEQISLKVHVNK